MSFRTTQRKTGGFLTLEVTISITYLLLGEMGGRGEDPGLAGQRGLRPPNAAVPTQEGASGVWPFQNLYEVKPDCTKVLVSHGLLCVAISKITKNQIGAVGTMQTPYPGEQNPV